MPHIDEGQLHAYLDGASPPEVDRERVRRHLEGCEDCRQRLEEARAVVEETGRLLAHVAPPPQQRPSFAELQARAAADKGTGGRPSEMAGGRRRTLWRSPLPLAWAASIAVAAGAGWLGRELLVERVGEPVEVRARLDERVAVEEPGEEASGQAATPGARKLAAERAPQAEEPEEPAPAGAAGISAATDRMERDRLRRGDVAAQAKAASLEAGRIAGCYRVDSASPREVLPRALELTTRPSERASPEGRYAVVAAQGGEGEVGRYVLEWKPLPGDSAWLGGSGPLGPISLRLALGEGTLEGRSRPRPRDEREAQAAAEGGTVRLSAVPCGE